MPKVGRLIVLVLLLRTQAALGAVNDAKIIEASQIVSVRVENENALIDQIAESSNELRERENLPKEKKQLLQQAFFDEFLDVAVAVSSGTPKSTDRLSRLSGSSIDMTVTPTVARQNDVHTYLADAIFKFLDFSSVTPVPTAERSADLSIKITNTSKIGIQRRLAMYLVNSINSGKVYFEDKPIVIGNLLDALGATRIADLDGDGFFERFFGDAITPPLIIGSVSAKYGYIDIESKDCPNVIDFRILGKERKKALAGFNLEVHHPGERPPLGFESRGTFLAGC